MKEYNHFEDFQPHVGTVFQVPLADGSSYPLTLTSAEARPNTANLSRTPFDLRFSGPGPDYLEQRIHVLQHDVLGTFSMFLGAIGQEEDGFRYQAVFN
ncbi:hypothetical protein ACCD06_28015 [Azospirillum sp. CT11-132]|uniref:DUF6916 family protein n=1 Tax=Azospirillum sp. CT11-132 TaxID=3396317 RepID=UPI0039A63457